MSNEIGRLMGSQGDGGQTGLTRGVNPRAQETSERRAYRYTRDLRTVHPTTETQRNVAVAGVGAVFGALMVTAGKLLGNGELPSKSATVAAAGLAGLASYIVSRPEVHRDAQIELLEAEIKQKEVYREQSREEHRKKMDKVAKELGMGEAPDQTSQEWSSLAASMFNKIKEEQCPSVDKECMLIDIFKSGTHEAADEHRESSEYEGLMTIVLKEWRERKKISSSSKQKIE